MQPTGTRSISKLSLSSAWVRLSNSARQIAGDPISKAALLVLLLAITLPGPDIRSETFDDTRDFGRIGRTPAHDDDLW